MYKIAHMAQLLLFLACNSMSHTLQCADIDTDFDVIFSNATARIKSSTGVVLNNKKKNMTVAISGDGSDVDMRQAEISDTLTIYIMGNDNTVAINHPNRLRLAIRGDNCHVTNQCKSHGTLLDIRGENSTYESELPLKRRPFGPFTNVSFTHIALAVTVVGLIAYLLHGR